MTNQCNATPKYQLEDLLAYIELGEPADIAQHIEVCAACSAEIEALKETSDIFSATLFRSACPSTDTLLEYSAYLLDTWQTYGIVKHLAICPHCSAEMADFKVPAPAQAGLRQTLSNLGRRVVQALPKPQSTEPAFAFRGESQQLDYVAGNYQITLVMRPPAPFHDTWEVEGQITDITAPDKSCAGNVALIQEQISSVSDVIDDLGYFVFEEVSPASYDLQLQIDDMTILITQVDVT